MHEFNMCSKCRLEYNIVSDRRFHAQPIACNKCGPVYALKKDGKIISDLNLILKEISHLLKDGYSIAVKGIGGYHLMCDAFNEKAVKELRSRKQRDSKPFAVMFSDIEILQKYCHAGIEEEYELKSWRRPVLILRQKINLSPSVSSSLNTTGAMLPYMPLHYMMFRYLATNAVVLTSANISDEPIIIDDDEADKKLGPITAAVLSCNREIYNRTDDSVIRIIDGQNTLIRRSRGIVPHPVYLRCSADGILAMGAEQKNSFCMGKADQALMSQYIGDLKNSKTFGFYLETIERFADLFRFKPEYIVCDKHPDYLSTRHAEFLEKDLALPLLKVQHHHAHIASCMAEYGLDEPVIGISFDGTGLGNDGNSWGGEFLLAELNDFRRFSYLSYVPMPGGDKVVEEPWRMAFSYLYTYFGDKFNFESVPVFRSQGESTLEMIRTILANRINCPFTSSAGRLFDAVAALIGLCSKTSFDSEPPMRLESVIDNTIEDYYPFLLADTVILDEMMDAILKDIESKEISAISARFHNTLVRIILEISKRMRDQTSVNKVILSGGVFQNQYLLEKSLYLLRGNRFEVFTNHLVPVNDGGISLGQMVIASKTRELCV